MALRPTGSRGMSLLTTPLNQSDPELYQLILKERRRQQSCLNMIASENYIAVSVLQCLSSCLVTKYSEGLPGKRYYAGTEVIDEIERLCQDRALKTFNLNSYEWGVNVQPYSGSPANLAVYMALLQPHDRIMGLDLPDGGHLSHGFMTAKRRVSASSIFYESMPYKVDPVTGMIDYDRLAENARLFKPKVIIAGISCYSRVLNYSRFREIADEHGAYLFSDMAHVSGLVAGGVIPSPFPYSDVVSTTTHKTLRGPKSGLIFYRKGFRSVGKRGQPLMYDLEDRVNQAVFPGLQGGPHNHHIAGTATTLLQAQSSEFKKYAKQIVLNSQALCRSLQQRGYRIATNGTDVHLLLVDLRGSGLDGAKAEYILEQVNIICNKNTVPGDTSALRPSGFRLGTAALTTQGFLEVDMETIAEFVDCALKIGQEVLEASGSKLSEFKKVVYAKSFARKIKELKSKVRKFAEAFSIPYFQYNL
ncbi:serine hydroxymethyltransferase-like [Homalodisca vitripennis]|uniref:serine hydroxymethyltransferase-like n=1 Tax=Homalodisca vitripennis TaxID=197043 RepID=UPI001EEB70AF|nr:serine hydroxymethyltransferase-like [Homalodisca vitripennis]XP_046660627.1 serine hydroxymethyltransferase-like [Homalodisca vitripennis]